VTELPPYYADSKVTVYQGDCLDVLGELPEQSVHCCITSPPYWGLRSYLPDGHDDKPRELGLEATPDEYVAKIVEVFRGVWRVLRDDGTLWLNLGDSYNAYNHNRGPSPSISGNNEEKYATAAVRGLCDAGLKPKDLCGIPWRVALALQADGWCLRSDIIWAKPNPMPESCTDRPTKAHEYIFLLTKKPRYFYDADVVREAAEYGRREWSNAEAVLASATKAGDKRANHGVRAKATVKGSDPSAGRNRRSVWTVATAPFPGAHFATFPPKLIEPCVLAGTSEKGCCPECGAPWVRVVEKEQLTRYRPNAYGKRQPGGMENTIDQTIAGTSSTTTGWRPTCKCRPETLEAGPIPCTVLDPFHGAGTTAMVAKANSRKYIGIELSAEYIDMSLPRFQQDTLF